jgi:hypothetical protein
MEPETRRSRVRRFKEFNRDHSMVLPILIGISLYVLLDGPVAPSEARC